MGMESLEQEGGTRISESYAPKGFQATPLYLSYCLNLLPRVSVNNKLNFGAETRRFRFR